MTLNRGILFSLVLAAGMFFAGGTAQADDCPPHGGCNQYGCWR